MRSIVPVRLAHRFGLGRHVVALVIVAGIAAPGPAAADPPAPPKEGPAGKRESYALLVGVNVYTWHPDWKLNGPANDTEALKEVLVKRYGFKDDPTHVRILSDAAGAGREPTRANIEAGFKWLADEAGLKKDDQVVILLAGHGLSQPADWAVPDNFEPDGVDEVFLPKDTGPYGNKRYENAITDDTLREWVDRVTDTGALAWVIMDCCHSGTALRGEVSRTPTTDLPKPGDVAAARAAGKQIEAGKAAFDGALLPSAPKVAAFFAAEAHRTTPEDVYPEFGGKTFGVFTRTICSVLADAPDREALTYRDLFQRVLGRYTLMRKDKASLPNPQPEGTLLLNEVCGTKVGLVPLPPISLARRGEQWRVTGGLLLDLYPGTVLSVHPGDTPGAAAAGYVRIKSSLTVEADVEPCDAKGDAPPADRDDLKPGMICRVHRRSTRSFLLPVAVFPRVIDPAKGPQETGREMPPAEAAALTKVIAALAQQDGAKVRAAAPNQQGAWLLFRAEGQTGELTLESPDRLRRYPVPLGPNADESLKQFFGKFVKAENLMYLAQLWGRREQSGLPGVGDVQVTMYVTRADGKEKFFPHGPFGAKPLPTFREDPEEGGEMMVWFDVGGQSDVDINLLAVNADFKIESLFPTAAQNNRMSPRPGEPYLLRINLKNPAEAVERLVLIAVNAEPGTVPADFRFLEQPALTRDKGRGILDNHRGTRGSQAALSEMLLAAGFPNVVDRAASTVTSNCVFRVFEYQALPPANDAK